MEKFYVKKVFEVSYAHRLLNYNGKCENLHGHNGKVEVILEVNKLDNQMMVMDFIKLKEIVRSWLDENMDHKVILSKKDPLVKILKKAKQELFETDENPTAEVLAQIIKNKLKEKGLSIKEVRFWETDTSMAAIKEE